LISRPPAVTCYHWKRLYPKSEKPVLSHYYSLAKIWNAMTVKIQTVRFDADAKLIEYVKQRVEKLHNFHDRITKVDVFLKLDNVVHNIKDKVAEIKVHVPRQHLFVKQTSKSFEQSFDEALNSLITQLKRKKEKQYDL
jgi:putative sigma-54 modulation protein